MYVEPNFKTKKALKEAVRSGQRVTVFQPGIFKPEARTGIVSVEGPHSPEPHRWYARVEIVDLVVKRVVL